MGPDYYGDMHCQGASISIVIGSANSWVAIPSGLVSSDHSGWAISGGNTLTCSETGIYHIMISCTLQCGSANQVISCTYAVSGTASTNVLGELEIVNTNRPYCVTCCDINRFNSGDALTIVLENNTAANNLTVNACTLTVVRVG